MNVCTSIRLHTEVSWHWGHFTAIPFNSLFARRRRALTFLLIQCLLYVRPILIDLVGHNPYNLIKSIAPTYNDFGALLALEAETLLRHLDRATQSSSAAAAGDHGVHLLLSRGELRILHGRVRITIGIQRVIELLPIIELHVAHKVPNYSPDECFKAYRHPCSHIASAKGSLRN